MKSVLMMLGTCAVPFTCVAQTRVDLTPFVGVYFPLSSVVSANGNTFTQTFAAAFGARLAIWGSKVGVELGGASAKSGLSPDNGASTAGTVTVGSFRLLVPIAQGTATCLATVGGCQPAIYASGGIGFIKRGGQAWQGVSGLTNLTGSLGIGLRIPVGSKLTARVDGEFLLYSASFGLPGNVRSSSQFDEDVVLSAGIWIPLAGGR